MSNKGHRTFTDLYLINNACYDTGNFCNSAHPSEHPIGRLLGFFFPFVPTIEMPTLFSFPSKNQKNAQGAVTENPGNNVYDIYSMSYMAIQFIL